MSKVQLKRVIVPFFTTRTTGQVGLGIPFFKAAAESTGGAFEIKSTFGVGTSVKAKFGLSNIDRMPLGNMTETMVALITFNDNIDFVYKFEVDKKSFVLNTKEFREILGDVSLNTPEVRKYIQDFLDENHQEVLN